MVDTLATINSGFYDAVDGDRTYSANDMNKPYKRLISEGVFATPQGTPSTDFQVTANDTMQVRVAKGYALLGERWAESTSALYFTVPANSTAQLRTDSVILQVDTRLESRKANIVYRTGTPRGSLTPAPPAINTNSSVFELRLANILVYRDATEITAAEISDTRGSSECPWITSLIQQPDTSTLWDRFNAAFTQLYNQQMTVFEGRVGQFEQQWDAFFRQLTQELSLTTTVITLTNKVTASGTISVVNIGIPSYDSSTDVLQVFINGMLADSSMYTATSLQITLTNAINAGDTVYFVVFKSLITGDLSTVSQAITNLNNRISALTVDSGWIELTLQNGSPYKGGTELKYRKYGNTVYLSGAVKGIMSPNTLIAELPVDCRPLRENDFTTALYNSQSGVFGGTVVIRINTAGQIHLVSASAYNADLKIPLDNMFILG